MTTGWILLLTPQATLAPPTSPPLEAYRGGFLLGGVLALFLAAGLYHLLFFLRRREAREHLYFSLLCAVAILYGLTSALTSWDRPPVALTQSRLWLLAVLAGGPLYVALVSRLFDVRPGRYGRLAALLCAGWAPVVALLPAPALATVHPLLCAGVGAGLLASVPWAGRRARQSPERLGLLFAALVAFIGTVLWDLLGGYGLLPVVRALPTLPGVAWVGFLILVAAVGFRTADSFAQAEASARTDPLTGLARRHVFEEAVAREAERRRRAGGMLILLVMDLDHFKQVNDTYGHRAGDIVLERVGHLLGHSARNVDLTARLGGEEFAVLLSDTDAEGAVAFADRVRQRLRGLEVVVPGGVVSGMTASVGVAVSTGWVDTEALLDAADRAMYEAKQGGRDRVVTVTLSADRPDPTDRPFALG